MFAWLLSSTDLKLLSHYSPSAIRVTQLCRLLQFTVYCDMFCGSIKLTSGLSVWQRRNGSSHKQWRRSVVKYRVRVSQFMLSNCQVPRKLSFTLHFWHVFHPRWCETCRVIQQQFWMKECDIWGVKTCSDPSCIFSGGEDPQPPGSTLLAIITDAYMDPFWLIDWLIDWCSIDLHDTTVVVVYRGVLCIHRLGYVGPTTDIAVQCWKAKM